MKLRGCIIPAGRQPGCRQNLGGSDGNAGEKTWETATPHVVSSRLKKPLRMGNRCLPFPGDGRKAWASLSSHGEYQPSKLCGKFFLQDLPRASHFPLSADIYFCQPGRPQTPTSTNWDHERGRCLFAAIVQVCTAAQFCHRFRLGCTGILHDSRTALAAMNRSEERVLRRQVEVGVTELHPTKPCSCGGSFRHMPSSYRDQPRGAPCQAPPSLIATAIQVPRLPPPKWRFLARRPAQFWAFLVG